MLQQPPPMVRTLLHVACMLLFVSAERGHALLTNETSCDRHRSRMVVRVLQEYMNPHLEKADYELPLSCPLHPSRNIYARQERHKIPMRRHHWKCGFCDAMLRSEHWLDNHLDAKHAEEVDEMADVCLADQCALVHCEYLSSWIEGHYIDGARTGPCRDRIMLERRQQCKVLADMCLPAAVSREVRLLNEFMVGSFCEAHTCYDKQRYRLLRRIRKAQRKGNVGYRFLVVIILILMLAFYIGLWIYHSQTSGYRSKSELPFRRSQRTGWLSRFTRAARTGKLD